MCPLMRLPDNQIRVDRTREQCVQLRLVLMPSQIAASGG